MTETAPNDRRPGALRRFLPLLVLAAGLGAFFALGLDRYVTLDTLRDRLRQAPMNELFVVDADDLLIGTITLAELGDAAFDHSQDGERCAGDLARRSPPVLAVSDDLQKAIRRFSEVDEGLLGVVDDHDGTRLMGCLHERDVMRAYNTALVNLRKEEHGETL